MLAESYVPSDEIRTLRDLVRTRKSLVEERTAEKNRVRAVLKRTDNAYDSDADRTIVKAHLSVIDEYDEQIDRLEEKIEQKVPESTAAETRTSSMISPASSITATCAYRLWTSIPRYIVCSPGTPVREAEIRLFGLSRVPRRAAPGLYRP
jgi:transposase